jgi:hypothetical protein
VSNRNGRFVIPLWRRTAFRLRCEESTKSRQTDGLCSCFSLLIEAIEVVAEDCGTTQIKEYFQSIIPYSVVEKFDGSQYKISLLYSRIKKSFDKDRTRMRFFISCWLKPFVSEVLFSEIYWSSEKCRMASGEEPSLHSVLKMPVHSLEDL